MAKPDRHFMNVFSAVLGILIAIALALIGVSRLVDSGPKGARDKDDPLMQAEAHKRIQPFGQVAVAGQDNAALAIVAPAAQVPTAPAPAAQAPAAPAPAAGAPAAGESTAAAPANGKSVYESACIVCHGAGIAGAPKVGDKAVWAARIAQGTAMLEQHAIAGYQGPTGFMPAKGGRMDLSDDAVKAAVGHMVSQSR